MSDRRDRLYELLPVVHRMRDADQGEPLRALLGVIADQVNVVEDDISGLYSNWFIETCEDWVVPYIGQLVGYEPAVDPGLASDNLTPSGRARARAIFPRADVAHTVRNRRRKGTLALLELLASEAAGWSARAVESFKLLSWSQEAGDVHRYRARLADVRRGDALDLVGTPFDAVARNVDVRRINSRHRTGRHNIPNVGLFVWRLNSYKVTATKAYCREDEGPNAFTFSVLGNDAPLFVNPIPEASPDTIAGELNLPGPIRRRALEQHQKDYIDNSFSISAPGWLRPGVSPRIVAADLSDLSAYRPRRNTVAVDPARGRILFPPDQPPKDGVIVSYHYGFAADMGGGEYPRRLSAPPGATIIRIGPGAHPTIQAALDEWTATGPKDAVIEFTASGVFVEPIAIDVPEGRSLELRAASGVRPVIRLIDWQTDRADSLVVSGAPNSRFVLDGLLIAGRAVHVSGNLAHFTIRHSTLVPGWGLGHDCAPRRPAEPSLEIFSATVAVHIEHSIVGSIQVTIPAPEGTTPTSPEIADEARCIGYHVDPLCLEISDSIVDATDVELEAIGAPGCAVAHVCLRILRTTVFGLVQAHAVTLAEDCIFDGVMFVARRQIGCVRFSYLTPGSRTPRRFHCQPDGDNGVAPVFNSRRYGRPDYAQLSLDCPPEISAGASDQSEMGAFHDLYQPQRTALLRARLDESVPAGMDAGIIFVN